MNTGINEEINTKDIVNLFRLTYQTVEDIRETHTEQDLGIVPFTTPFRITFWRRFLNIGKWGYFLRMTRDMQQ